MKKAVSVLLVLLTVFALTSCGAGGTDDTVDVVIPASLVSEDAASGKLTTEQKKQGIVRAAVQDDGAVTYTFRRDQYEEYVRELHDTTAKSLDQIIHDENATSIKKVTYNDDFSELTFTVDRAAFEGSMDGLTCYGAYLAVSVYKAYAQKDDKCTITIVDETTGETLGTVTYPDAMTANE